MALQILQPLQLVLGQHLINAHDMEQLKINLSWIYSVLIDNEIDWIPSGWFDLPNLEYM